MFSTSEIQKVIAEQYTSSIRFNLEVTGMESMPRSTNIARIAWANDGREYPLFVEFFGRTKKDGTVTPNSGYIYKVDYNVWRELSAGADAEDRPSAGVVFHQQVRGKSDFDKVF